MDKLSFKIKTGNEIVEVIQDLAALRIAVFRDYPYLYDGSLAYELDYLKTYLQAPTAFLFAVYDGDIMVGATTCIPLGNETLDVQQPFMDAGLPIDEILYYGESILLPAYRKNGIGKRFFEEREKYAFSLGVIKTVCFCAVVRPEDHPAKPKNYKPLDIFWTSLGYVKNANMLSYLEWKDLDKMETTAKPMVFWFKSLRA